MFSQLCHSINVSLDRSFSLVRCLYIKIAVNMDRVKSTFGKYEQRSCVSVFSLLINI